MGPRTDEASTRTVSTAGLRAAVIIGTGRRRSSSRRSFASFADRGVDTIVIGTGQHRDLVDPVLALFDVALDHDLQIMEPDASLNAVLSRAIDRLDAVLELLRPDVVMVQGDTTSALGGALAAFNTRIRVAHVEAGLRSHNLALPYPEEMHRRVISIVSSWHFAPTEHAAAELRSERCRAGSSSPATPWSMRSRHILGARGARAGRDAEAVQPYVLATAHRRESWGAPIRNIAMALRDVLHEHPELSVVFATHPNPRARNPVEEVARLRATRHGRRRHGVRRVPGGPAWSGARRDRFGRGPGGGADAGHTGPRHARRHRAAGGPRRGCRAHGGNGTRADPAGGRPAARRPGRASPDGGSRPRRLRRRDRRPSDRGRPARGRGRRGQASRKPRAVSPA